jgi:REP element-mobilizing transposase RayT
MVTRRCIDRRYLLRPDAEVRAALEYLMAVGMARFGVAIVAAVFLSNHYHLIISDPAGRYPAFLQWFDSLVARVVNCHRGRWGRFWDGEQVHVEILLDAEAVERKIVYTLANAVAAGLVEYGSEWPGVRSSPQVWVRPPKVVKRPAWFFQPDGVMPAEAELAYAVPPTHEGMAPAEFAARIARRVSAEEERLRALQNEAKRPFLGARGVLRQRWSSRPRTSEIRRKIKPLVAGPRETCKAALAAIRLFRWIYWEALDAWRLGDRQASFPPGTWRMGELHRASRQPPPGFLAVLAGFRAPPAPPAPPLALA